MLCDIWTPKQGHRTLQVQSHTTALCSTPVPSAATLPCDPAWRVPVWRPPCRSAPLTRGLFWAESGQSGISRCSGPTRDLAAARAPTRPWTGDKPGGHEGGHVQLQREGHVGGDLPPELGRVLEPLQKREREAVVSAAPSLFRLPRPQQSPGTASTHATAPTGSGQPPKARNAGT